MSSVPGISDELSASLTAGLDAVDHCLRQAVDHDDPFVAQASGHLLAAGGKRFRPLLTLLASHVGTGWNEQVVTAAAGVELTHLASLYHDDVMDEATMRRGVPSANVAYSNTTAILVGDLLFGRASSLIAELGAEAVKIQAETFVRLCAGQIRDARPVASGDPLASYLSVLSDKTGVLIATAARYGGMFGGCTPEQTEILAQYGELLGVCFQLADDILDITSETSGKTPGTDLREGVTTLPVIYARAAEPAGSRLADLLSRPLDDDAEHAEALALMRGHVAVEQAREHTRQLAAEARDLLQPLPESEAKQALVDLVDGVVHRDV